MANYGIIDCGSNTVRLCIYRVDDDTKKVYRKRDFHTLLNDKTMAGLAAHIQNGVMTERGIARAAEAIRDHLARAEYFRCERLDVFATAFLRNCENRKEAKRAIERAAGVRITLLSAWDEAHLGFIGARCATPEMTDGVLADIGGGSTELTRIDGGVDCDNISIPQGSLSSFSSHVRGIMPTQAEIRTIAQEFQSNIELDRHYHSRRCDILFAIGGSARAVARVYGEAFCEGRRPNELTASQVKRILELFEESPNVFVHIALKATPDRVHTVLPGCIIADCLMKYFGAQRMIVCKCGVREGYLIDRILGTDTEDFPTCRKARHD